MKGFKKLSHKGCAKTAAIPGTIKAVKPVNIQSLILVNIEVSSSGFLLVLIFSLFVGNKTDKLSNISFLFFSEYVSNVEDNKFFNVFF